MALYFPVEHHYMVVSHHPSDHAVSDAKYVIKRYNKILYGLMERAKSGHVCDRIEREFNLILKIRDQLIQDFELEDEFAIDTGKG